MWFSILFGAVFSLAGAVPLYLAIRTFRRDRAMARWPRAPGKITSASVRSSTRKSRDRQGYTVEWTGHEPIVTYTYTVDGRELTGDKIARDVPVSGTKPDISRWPVGGDVMVLYDPSDPKTAYLETRVSIGAVILAGMGSVFLIVGLLVPILVNFAGGSP